MTQLTARQLAEWEAYDRIDPVGNWVEDFRFARLMALLVNLAMAIHRDPKKPKPKDAVPADFMVNWLGEEKEVKKQDVEEMKAILLSIASAQNRNIKLRQKRQGGEPPAKKKEDGNVTRNIEDNTRS